MYDFTLCWTLIGIPSTISAAAVGLKIRLITLLMKKYKSMIKEKGRKKHDKILLLAKEKLKNHRSINF